MKRIISIIVLVLVTTLGAATEGVGGIVRVRSLRGDVIEEIQYPIGMEVPLNSIKAELVSRKKVDPIDKIVAQSIDKAVLPNSGILELLVITRKKSYQVENGEKLYNKITHI
jgi:hypothetical protein